MKQRKCSFLDVIILITIVFAVATGCHEIIGWSLTHSFSNIMIILIFMRVMAIKEGEK